MAKPKAHGPFSAHWAVPLSTAAVIFLSLGVFLLLTTPGTLNEREDTAVLAAEAPAPPLTAQGTDARRDMVSSAMESEKVESNVAAPATAPTIRERVAEERAVPARNSVLTQDKLKNETAMTAIQADVIAVETSGEAGAYQFDVSVHSPDLGCKQYADWWKVVSEGGKLLYRRLLMHSHVDEQAFTSSGAPVPIQPDTMVWVRAHMNTGGYGGNAFKGSVKIGLKQAAPEVGFAAGLAQQPPLPDGCDF